MQHDCDMRIARSFRFLSVFFIGNSLTASCPSLGLKHIFALSDEEVCER
jgi:hypothetical protein